MNTHELATDIVDFLDEYEFFDIRDAYENMDEAIEDTVNMLKTCPDHIYDYFNEYYNETDFMPAAGNIMNRIRAFM